MIASVEEGLGLPSPSELAKDKEGEEEERRLAEGVSLLTHSYCAYSENVFPTQLL